MSGVNAIALDKNVRITMASHFLLIVMRGKMLIPYTARRNPELLSTPLRASLARYLDVHL